MNNETFIRPLVKRKKVKIERDTSRVITRANIPRMSRIRKIIDRVLTLTEMEAENLLQEIDFNFVDRHKNINIQFKKHFDNVVEFVPKIEHISQTKKMLIGAYFTMEYAIESAALFNPSIIPHPDQSGVPEGSIRLIMSLRATGEGHISSIVFRSGIIKSDYSFHFDSISQFALTPELSHNTVYDKNSFCLKLKDMKTLDETCIRILDQVSDVFTYQELKKSIGLLSLDLNFKCKDKSLNTIKWLANSNYKLVFDKKSKISERVIYPVSENESRGIEDARFVQFHDENGDVNYYATYTAYNGYKVLSNLIETKDFLTFNIVTLKGKALRNKGMALFPRKINGKYVMLSRQDGENNYIMFSDSLSYWPNYQILQEPEQPWEFVQIGNCGSPIEINEGWLVLTHGVGPMRQYCIGAILLDKENPEKVIARLVKPLLTPNEKEREGYVPNVVYSCGSMIHNNMLIIPYAMSDITSGIATVYVKDLIDCMKFNK
jgi:predicted GH43/DUF377 family glycosyl hydrolase